MGKEKPPRTKKLEQPPHQATVLHTQEDLITINVTKR